MLGCRLYGFALRIACGLGLLLAALVRFDGSRCDLHRERVLSLLDGDALLGLGRAERLFLSRARLCNGDVIEPCELVGRWTTSARATARRRGAARRGRGQILGHDRHLFGGGDAGQRSDVLELASQRYAFAA